MLFRSFQNQQFPPRQQPYVPPPFRNQGPPNPQVNNNEPPMEPWMKDFMEGQKQIMELLRQYKAHLESKSKFPSQPMHQNPNQSNTATVAECLAKNLSHINDNVVVSQNNKQNKNK